VTATFADVVDGRRAVHEVARDPHHVAWLAERPVRAGHVVVATARAADSVLDLTADEHAALWAFVRRVALALRERLPCARVCVSVIGWAVRHAHVHLVPTDAAGQVPGLGARCSGSQRSGERRCGALKASSPSSVRR
jgi:histidine triad (HIT) family protein